MKQEKPFEYHDAEYLTLNELLRNISTEDMKSLYALFLNKDEAFCSFLKNQVPQVYNRYEGKNPGWAHLFKQIYVKYIEGYSDNRILKIRLASLEKVAEIELEENAIGEHLDIISSRQHDDGKIIIQFPEGNFSARKTVRFGKYHFYEDGAKEEIEWFVIAESQDKMLLASCCGLDAKPFNEEKSSNDFQSSSLADWLKNSFLKEAFSDEEKLLIDEGPFILTAKEAEKYFQSFHDRTIAPTPYAAKKGVPTFKNGFAWWWLASPGGMDNTAAYVNYNGKIKMAGEFVYLDSIAVRPAMVIKKPH